MNEHNFARQDTPKRRLGVSHRLVQVETDFDLHPAIYRFSIRAKRGLHLPFLYLLQRLFIQAQARTLRHYWIDDLSVSSHCYVQNNCSAIFGGSSFVGVLRWRAVNALRRDDSIHPGASHFTVRSCVIISRLLRYCN